MTGREYQELAKVTQNLTLDKTQQLLNGCCGLAGESGKVIDIVKKHAFQGHELDTEHIMEEELGDVMWYIALLCNAIGTDLSEVMNENIQKLKRRYLEGFDTDKSVNREVDNIEHKYYIKHRWLDVEIGSGYVNYVKELNCVELHDRTHSSEYQTEFTASEIEELKEKHNTTLEDFEIIPVEVEEI